LFSVAFSILFLAQTTPSTLPTTENVAAALVRPADTAPAEITHPTTDAVGTVAMPTTVPTSQGAISIGPDLGKTVTITGVFLKVDAGAKTITVKTDTAAEDTYYVEPNTAITIDGKPSTWDALASIGPATLTISAGPAKNATSIAAVSPPWWQKIANINPIVLMILPLGLFMIISVRNKKKQEKAQQEKLGSIKRGDRIQTIGGIIGNVVQAEESRILVKVDESNNTKIWFARSAVGRVLGEEKSADSKSR
jgi:preprotein translocase subunit YajC